MGDDLSMVSGEASGELRPGPPQPASQAGPALPEVVCSHCNPPPAPDELGLVLSRFARQVTRLGL